MRRVDHAVHAGIVALAAGIVMATAGCEAPSESEPAFIAAAEATSTDSQVAISLSHVCGRDFDVRVREDSETVTVDIETDTSDEACDGLVAWRIDLDAPLADRALVDGSTDKEVPVADPENP